MNASRFGYFVSLSEELHAQAARVRQLIGDAHWGHDGRHKELLLQDLIRRHCPSTVRVITGFVISPTDPEIRSKEQDLLVIDARREAPFFQQGDLAMAFPHTVLAAISVKSQMTSSSMESVIDGLQTVRQVAHTANVEQQQIWCGGFFYGVEEDWLADPSKIYRSITKRVLANPTKKSILQPQGPHVLGPDVIADAKDLAFLLDYEREERSARIRGYVCKGVATAVFLSCLLEHISLRFCAGECLLTDLLADLQIPRLDPPTFKMDDAPTSKTA